MNQTIMRHILVDRCDSSARALSVASRLWNVALLVSSCIPMPTSAQVISPGAPNITVLAPGVAATTRYAQTVSVPTSRAPNLRLELRLGALRLEDGSREIKVPAQGFYVAELRNGNVITVIDGTEMPRHSGELWAVNAGQTMTVKIVDRRQQNALLHIFSVRPTQ